MLDLLFLSVAETEPGLVEQIGLFFEEGGIFMVLLGFTSIAGIAAIFFKILSLRKSRVLPARLVAEVEAFSGMSSAGETESLMREFQRGTSTLARLCAMTMSQRGRSQSDIAEAVQSMARAEIVRLHAGMTVIDVVTSVAPLLGLLGTASGLVVVFSGIESDADWMMITGGIGRALKTTIVGMAIAVPSIIAEGYFHRKIETFAAQLEVLLTKLAHACESNPRVDKGRGSSDSVG
jgi:biopolymer transport protein ExbB